MGTLFWRYWRGGAAALVGLAGLALIAFGPAGIALGTRDLAQRQAQAAATAGHPLGREVRDGPVSFVVHQVNCGKLETGSRSRFGQLCEVTVEARNDGTEEVTVPGVAQRLRSSEGARHAPIARPGSNPFGTLAPGQAATATVRFDLPAQATATHVEVHASPYTRGQPVVIGGAVVPLVGVKPG